jgi:EmrB/QacA subfamily drug resistance transporter
MHDVGAGTPAPAGEAPLDPRRWWTLAVLCLSLLIVSVGNSSLNVALPTLAEDLHASNSQLQWVVAAYSLVFAGLLFTAGSLGDRFGRKGALQLGLLLFLVGAALASRSTSMHELIACRALMGGAAALIMPSTLSILVNVFPARERPKAIAIWAVTTGGAVALGPITSGVLLEHFWYGSIFLINVPIIAIALVAGRFLVPTSKDSKQAALDPLGALLSTAGIVAVVYGLIQAPEQGWGSASTLAAFVIGAVILTLFVLWEQRLDDPMLDVGLFRQPAFSVGSGGMTLIFLTMYGVMFLVTLYFQLVLDYSPLGAAVRFLPISPLMIVVATCTPRLAQRFGAHRVVAGGLAFIAAGFIAFQWLQVDSPYLFVISGIMLTNTGIALAMSPMTSSIMSAVPTRRAGTGSAMNDATRELGAALGVAVMGSLAASRYGHAFGSAIDLVPAGARGEAKTSLAGALDQARGLAPGARETVTTAARQAFVDGLRFTSLLGAFVAVAAGVVVYRMLPHKAAHESEVEAIERMAELGLGGTMPAVASDTFD